MLLRYTITSIMATFPMYYIGTRARTELLPGVNKTFKVTPMALYMFAWGNMRRSTCRLYTKSTHRMDKADLAEAAEAAWGW